jgi:1,4-dihydroxy-2-naphthoate octaprenyltransferase
MAMPSVKAFAGVARAPFLALSVTLIASGAAAGLYEGTFVWTRTLVALLGLVALHMAVDIFNEWSDMRRGIDLHTQRTPFSGGSGTLPAGEMSLGTAFAFGVVCSLVGLAAGIYFLLQLGAVMVPFLVLGAVCVLAYTDLLARIGVGELAAGLGLGGLPVMGAALVQGGHIGPVAVAAAVPAFLMTFNLLLLNEFPDEKADRAGGRRNLILMLGRRAAARIYAAAALAVPVSIVASIAMGVLPGWCALALLPSLLLVKPLGWTLGNTDEDVPIPALASNVMWNLGTNTLMAVALVVAA